LPTREDWIGALVIVAFFACAFLLCWLALMAGPMG
jgi:hypothetical protein